METKKAGSIPSRRGYIACIIVLVLLLLLSPWWSNSIELWGTLHRPSRDIRLSPPDTKVDCVQASPAQAKSDPADPTAAASSPLPAASPVAAASPAPASSSPSASSAPAGTSNALFSSLWQLNALQGAIPHTHVGAWAGLANTAIRSHLEKTSKAAAPDQAGPSMQPATCDEIYGLTFLQSWRQGMLCKPPDAAPADGPTTSSITARFVTLGAGAAKPSRYIVMEGTNLLLDSLGFSGSSDGDGNPRPTPGSLKADCALQRDREPYNEYSELRAVRQVLRDALEDNQGPAVQQACSAGAPNVIEHPVLLLQRYDTTNIYHFLEDVLTAFNALSVLNSSAVQAKGVEVVIADNKALGFYMEVWQRLSYPHPLRILKRDPFPPGTCLRHAIFTQFAPPSLLSLKWQLPHLLAPVGGANCLAATYIGMSSWLRALFPEITSLTRTLSVPLQSHDGDGAGGAITTKTVLWVSRRNYESIHSGKFTDWQQRRIYGNENQLLLALKKTVLEWNDRSCFRQRSAQPGCRDRRVVFELQVIEPSDVPFYPRQLQSFSSMSVLMGVHGAGMANAMWMAPFSGGVIEVQHNVAGQPHYSHLSQALGQRYTMVSSSGGDINVDRTADALRAMLDEVA